MQGRKVISHPSLNDDRGLLRSSRQLKLPEAISMTQPKLWLSHEERHLSRKESKRPKKVGRKALFSF